MNSGFRETQYHTFLRGSLDITGPQLCIRMLSAADNSKISKNWCKRWGFMSSYITRNPEAGVSKAGLKSDWLVAGHGVSTCGGCSIPSSQDGVQSRLRRGWHVLLPVLLFSSGWKSFPRSSQQVSCQVSSTRSGT